MAIYETIFILDSLLTPEEIDKVVDRVKELIEGNKGKILKIDKWGKRRLAYEIQKKQYGFYVAIEFEEKGTVPRLLDDEFNYNDRVLRYLTYRFGKKKLKDWEENKKQEAASELEVKSPKVEEESLTESTDTKKEVPDENATN